MSVCSQSYRYLKKTVNFTTSFSHRGSSRSTNINVNVNGNGNSCLFSNPIVPQTSFPKNFNSFHSSSTCLKESSSTNEDDSKPSVNRIQYFNHNETLHFILSSKLSGSSSQQITKEKHSIYSPALFINEEEKKKIFSVDDGDDDSNNLQMIQDISSVVESRYTLDGDSSKEQFVGGMGENDGGVWFTVDEIDDFDTLDYWEQIRDVIQAIKESRHGIPFGIYTSGIVHNRNNIDMTMNLKEQIGISSLQVTLGSGDPQSYQQVVDCSSRNNIDGNAAFGQVCNFMVQSSESGFPVTAAVAGGKYSSSGNELAKALGAVEVVVYDKIQ